jgi:hypothetical protein
MKAMTITNQMIYYGPNVITFIKITKIKKKKHDRIWQLAAKL